MEKATATELEAREIAPDGSTLTTAPPDADAILPGAMNDPLGRVPTGRVATCWKDGVSVRLFPLSTRPATVATDPSTVTERAANPDGTTPRVNGRTVVPPIQDVDFLMCIAPVEVLYHPNPFGACVNPFI